MTSHGGETLWYTPASLRADEKNSQPGQRSRLAERHKTAFNGTGCGVSRIFRHRPYNEAPRHRPTARLRWPSGLDTMIPSNPKDRRPCPAPSGQHRTQR
jgi:hypothetical protein